MQYQNILMQNFGTKNFDDSTSIHQIHQSFPLSKFYTIRYSSILLKKPYNYTKHATYIYIYQECITFKLCHHGIKSSKIIVHIIGYGHSIFSLSITIPIIMGSGKLTCNALPFTIR